MGDTDNVPQEGKERLSLLGLRMGGITYFKHTLLLYINTKESFYMDWT